MRLIDADKLTADSDFVVSHVALIKQCGMKHQSGCNAPTCEECFARLFKHYEHLAPTVEAEPVKHGKWLDNRHTDTAVCSVCGAVYGDETSYCPKCGAKMEMNKRYDR